MTFSLKNEAAIAGVGESNYFRHPGSGVSALKLMLDAALAAIRDAGLQPNDIDGVMAPFMNASAEDFATNLGIRDLRYAAQINMGGASAVAALQSAAMAVTFGLANYVLVATGWNGYSGVRARDISESDAALPISGSLTDYCMPWGSTSPIQWYAVYAQRYMHEFGSIRAEMGMIACTIRDHAQRNPKSLFRGRPLSMDEYLASPVISTPYLSADCCRDSDAAAAVIVTTADRARRLTGHHPVLIAGIAEGHPYPADDFTNRQNFLEMGLSHAAPRAYEMAGMGPEDMNFAQIYDPFTFEVIHQLEEAGFSRRGEGAAFISSGAIALGSKLPVNTHGGLLSEAHVLGMSHVVEATRQLRHEADARQVAGARAGIVTGCGDFGDGSIAVLTRQ